MSCIVRVMPTERAGRGPGPSRAGVLVLALAALALIATSPAPARLESSAIGEVWLFGGEPVEHEVNVRLEPDAVRDATRSMIRVVFLTSNGLDVAYATDAAIAVTPADVPLDACGDGCDLPYVVRVDPGSGVLPGSVARYRVELEIEYGGSYGDRSPTLATITLDHPASGPVPVLWSVLVGIAGLIAGWLVAPRVDARLGRRRSWPAVVLAALPVTVTVGLVAQRVLVMASYGLDRVDVVDALLFLADPWSLGLLGALTWGVARGIRRWDEDGGWSLGLGAVAMAGLGGLWLGWWQTLQSTTQPVVAAIGALALGLLAGTVIGQGWRVDPRAAHDRLAAGAAILSHGIVIAGFAYLALSALYDPFEAVYGGLVTLIPAGLIALALWRWFRGGRAWLVLFDLLVAATGVLGVLITFSSSSLFSLGPEAIGSAAVGLAVSASIVALITAFHRMPGSPKPPVPPPAPALDPSPTTT